MIRVELNPARQPGVPGVSLGSELGRGAFGTVYRGHHEALAMEVAVKIIQPGPGQHAALDQALGEARLMARLDHPNLLRVLDAGRLGDAIYLVMEFMDGGTLGAQRGLEAPALEEAARQLLSGLQALHEARIIHRDIKPANALRRQRDGRLKLADLGVAIEQATREDSQASLTGTLPFMAPELFEGAPVFNPRTDLYALGLTLACLALDEDPFPSRSAAQVLHWIGRGAPVPVAERRPDLPSHLTGLLARLMSRRPEERPASAADALALLDAPRPASVASAEDRARRIGPWVQGVDIVTTTNWHAMAVSHLHTGLAARLTWLRAAGPLAANGEVILDSAARAARLDHPGLLQVLDWGQHEGQTFVVTEPQGQRLRALVDSGGPLGEVEALELTAALAEALACLHQQGLVYQVVEPGSALITPDGRGAMLGWPVFCVPEGSSPIDAQGRPRRVHVSPNFAPEALDPRTAITPAVDLYGLGEVLFFLLNGRDAFEGGALMQVAMAKARPPALEAHVPTVTRPTAALVASLLDPDPARRPADAGALAADMRRVASRLRPGRQGLPRALGARHQETW